MKDMQFKGMGSEWTLASDVAAASLERSTTLRLSMRGAAREYWSIKPVPRTDRKVVAMTWTRALLY
jgi:hypothetical protein